MSTLNLILFTILIILALIGVAFFILKKQKEKSQIKSSERLEYIKEKQENANSVVKNQFSSGDPSTQTTLTPVLESSNEIHKSKKKAVVIKKQKDEKQDNKNLKSREQAISALKDSGIANPVEALKNTILSEEATDVDSDRALILIVDDSPASLYSAKRALSDKYNIVTAKNGIDALDVIGSLYKKGQTPNLIVSDVDMPELDGFGLVNRLAADLRLSDIPVIIMTSHLELHIPIATDKKGIRGLLTKPYKNQELQSQVEYLLNN